MNTQELHSLLENLTQEAENEWLEFKKGKFADAPRLAEEIGMRISALSNGACLNNRQKGYLIFGIEDITLEIIGTNFKAKSTKIGNEDVEHWIAQRLNPRIDFKIHEFQYHEKHITLFEIPAANVRPVRFIHNAYVRVGSITRNLNEFPEKEKKIWQKETEKDFEEKIILRNQTGADIYRLLDIQSYFDLMQIPFPSTTEGVLDKFAKAKLIIPEGQMFHITNLGALLFAKKLHDFDGLETKAPRVIVYDGRNRVKTITEQAGSKGYASGFIGLIDYINDKLPSNEEITKALRETVRMYPPIAIRELVANALIHQDFNERGTGPMIEVFVDRIEFTNPGRAIIQPVRFIDENQSRNEKLASLMRKLRICEEKGSGIDKVIDAVEVFQLPAPKIEEQEKHTKVTLYAHQSLNEMDRENKIRACYQHCCLKYVSNQKMTNQTLRERFKIEPKNAATASRIIADTLKEELIKEENENNTSRKFASYVPFWA